MGLYNSGSWKGLFAIEKSPDAFKTLSHNLIEKKNHFDWPDWLPQTAHDINEVLTNHESELLELRDKVDLVAGGPPCQGFSSSGKRNEGDTRNLLINSYIKLVRIVQPKVIFFENVRGFTQKFKKNQTKGKAYSEHVIKALKRKGPNFSGYDVYAQLVDFSDYGVPQKRTRFILVGIRKDYASSAGIAPKQFFDLISANRESFLVNKGIGPSTNLKDAISDLLKGGNTITCADTNGYLAGVYGPPESEYQRVLRSEMESTCIPDSHRFVKHNSITTAKFKYYLSNAEKNKTLNEAIKNKFNLKKRTLIPLSGDSPAASLTTLPDDYLHFCEPRIFTVREYARIQSFNDWFEFKGKYTTGGDRRTSETPRYTQIGNAIPPLFGEQAGIVLSRLIS